VVRKAGLDAVARRKKSLHCNCRESNPGRLARSVVTILSYRGYGLLRISTKIKESNSQRTKRKAVTLPGMISLPYVL
jgi:hypothetical protein